MRRSAVTFFAGFACGMSFLGVLLWRQGPPPRLISAAGKPILTKTIPAQLPSPPKRPSKLLIPVEGVTANDLADTFDQLRGGHRHEAIDIPAPRGTPVLAAADGKLVKLFRSQAGGLTVYQFDNTETLCFYYAHLDHYAYGLSEGALLRRGQVLGYVGTSGDAPPNTPHLHFAIFRLGPEKQWWQGTPVNPYPLLIGQ